jgi:hypothetical protein
MKRISKTPVGDLLELLELRRAPLPDYDVPAAYQRVRVVYEFGFEAGYRGWPLAVSADAGKATYSRSMYYQFTCRLSIRRHALVAAYHAGRATAAELLQKRLRGSGLAATLLSGPGEPEVPVDLRELHLRSSQLPDWKENSDSEPWNAGFEAGFRDWQNFRAHERPAYRSDYELGHAAGRRAFRRRLEQEISAREYAAGFQSGVHRGRRSAQQSPGWSTGYRDGLRFSHAR